MGIEECFKQANKNFEYPEVFSFNDEHLPSTIMSQAIFSFTEKDKEFQGHIFELQKVKTSLLRQSVYQGNVSNLYNDMKKIDQIGVKKEEPII